MKKFLKIALVLIVMVAGCILLLRAAVLHFADGELGAAHEYSVLQGYEFRGRDMAHDSSFIIKARDEDTNADVLGLPRLDTEKGYVWFITNPQTTPKVKLIPEGAPFSITDDDLIEVKQRLELMPEVEHYLLEHRQPLPH